MNNYKVYQHLFPNGKSYIGITCQKPEMRWRKGKGYAETTFVYRAIQKYGWNNIQHLILFTDLSKKEAEQKEQELIQLLDTTNPQKGYNLTYGGEGVLKYDYDRVIQLWNQGKTILEISEICGMHVSTLNRFLEVGGYNRQQNKIKQLEKKVNQYDLNGHYLATFDSLKKAAQAVGASNNSGICNCCQGKMYQSKGYQWRYDKGEYNDIEPVKSRKDVMPGKIVEQYDLNNNLIATYNKIVEAASAVDASPSSISAALNGRHSTCKGFVWRYK